MFSVIHFHPAHPARPGKPARFKQAAAHCGLAALLTLTAATAQVASAQVAAGTTGIDATGNAKNEMAACRSGKTQQDKATCITEVRNANAAIRAGKVDNGNDQFAANALKRCDVFKNEDDRNACKARIASDANAEGSVAGGGVIRKAEIVIAPAAQ